jgi:hypothetical protein
MKRMLLIALLLLIGLAAIPACSCSNSDKGSGEREKEVCSKLYQFLVGKFQTVYGDDSSAKYSSLKAETWEAVSKGNGRWTIKAIGAFDYSTNENNAATWSLDNSGGLWQYMELTGDITPINQEASDYMRWYKLY